MSTDAVTPDEIDDLARRAQAGDATRSRPC